MEKGLLLDRYRPLSTIGEGGHGDVILAYDTRIARRVAIKRIPLPAGERGRASGLREARTTAMLNHPAIVTVHEYESDAEYAYIVMEYVDGATLADLLDERGGPLDSDETAALVTEIADALDYGHTNGVLHCDIKPENVLVTRDGRVKVADFGIAALTGLGGSAESDAGTIGYMPLEQLRGEPLDARSDVWAFAALIYEALAFANPFVAESIEGAAFKAEVAQTPAPSEFEPGLDPGIDDALLGALSADPDARPDSARALALELLPVLGDPQEGREKLAAEVVMLVGEEESAEEDWEALGAWDRLAVHGHWARRIAAAVVGGWAAYVGLAPFALGSSAMWGAAGLTALAGMLAPGLGLGLGIAAMCAGTLQAAGVVAFALFTFPAVFFWVAMARRGRADSLGPVLAPVAGLLRVGPSVPVLLGWAYGPIRAALSGGLAGIVLTLASAVSGSRAPYLAPDWRFFADPWAGGVLRQNAARLLDSPGVLVAIVAWGLAGAVTALFCRRATRLRAGIGSVLGLAVLAAGYAGWSVLEPTIVWPTSALLEQVAGSALLVMIVLAAGPPTHTGS